MKTFQDVQSRLKLELRHWFNRQLKVPHDRFYLYYQATTAEHDGGFAIYRDKPANPDCQLADPRHIRRDMTLEQNASWLSEVLFKLPILAR